MGGGAHAGFGSLPTVVLQQGGHGVDECGVYQRFVALHVDNDIVTLQPQLCAGLGQPVTAAGVVGAGHDGIHPMGCAGLQNAGVVCSHHHADGGALCSTLGHAHHHGQARNVGQGLVGQAARRHACRYQHGKGAVGGSGHGGAHCSSSSSVRGRASFSSSTGIPSRTG